MTSKYWKPETNIYERKFSIINDGVSPEIKSFREAHSKNETYLYNNRLCFYSGANGIALTGLISREQYDINHKWIKES